MHAGEIDELAEVCRKLAISLSLGRSVVLDELAGTMRQYVVAACGSDGRAGALGDAAFSCMMREGSRLFLNEDAVESGGPSECVCSAGDSRALGEAIASCVMLEGRRVFGSDE